MQTPFSQFAAPQRGVFHAGFSAGVPVVSAHMPQHSSRVAGILLGFPHHSRPPAPNGNTVSQYVSNELFTGWVEHLAGGGSKPYPTSAFAWSTPLRPEQLMIPPSLGRCPSLTHLRLASLPGLTGGIPATLGDCESLCSLVLSYNKGERGEGRRELETYG